MMNLYQSLNDDIRCEIANHFLDKVQYVCVFENCPAEQRLCCSYCKFRFHSQHIQQLVKISEFTNKVNKDGEFLNMKLQEKSQKGQLNQLYEQKIDKKISDEVQYANMSIQGIFSQIRQEVNQNIQQINNSIDERALGQSVFDLQTKVQWIINKPWSYQSNESINLMSKIYRGDRYGELLEDEYFISQKNIQSINNYFTLVHHKLDAFFKHIQEQIPLIFKESMQDIFDKSGIEMNSNIRRKEKDVTYPQIRTASMRNEQNGNRSYNIQNGQLNEDKSLSLTQRNRSKRDSENQNGSYEQDNPQLYQQFQQQRLNNNQYGQRLNNSLGSLYNNDQNQRPTSNNFKQQDNPFSNQSNRNNQDSLDNFTQQQKLNNRLQNSGYYPFNNEDTFSNQPDALNQYMSAKSNRGANLKQNSLDRNNQKQFQGNQGENYDENANRVLLNKFKNDQNNQLSLQRPQLQNGRDSPNQYQEYSSPIRLNSPINQMYNQNNPTSLKYIPNEEENQSPIKSFDNPHKSRQMMSIILPSDNIKYNIPQGSKAYIPNESQNKLASQSHIKQPPEQINFENCKIKVVEQPNTFLNKPIETDSSKVKTNKPQKGWTVQQKLPDDLPQLKILNDAQEEHGYLDIPNTNNGQSRLGVYKSEKGNNYYDGEWLQGKKHGKGTLIMDDGSIYQGEFKNDEMTGKGRIIKKEGDIYEGDFQKDVFDGKGLLRYANGTEYIGNFKNNCFEGSGRKSWPNGAYYEGNFTGNQREGKGVFMWKNGSFYQGDFANNQFNGKGIYQWQSGRLYDGEWKDGKMDGRGRDILEQGFIYDGQYQNDKKQGYGVFIFNENKLYKGNWDNDHPHGEGVMIENGVEKKGVWEHGQLVKKL